jgi:hypothetical protein
LQSAAAQELYSVNRRRRVSAVRPSFDTKCNTLHRAAVQYIDKLGHVTLIVLYFTKVVKIMTAYDDPVIALQIVALRDE